MAMPTVLYRLTPDSSEQKERVPAALDVAGLAAADPVLPGEPASPADPVVLGVPATVPAVPEMPVVAPGEPLPFAIGAPTTTGVPFTLYPFS